MSTKAGTIGVSARPAVFTLWTVAVSALAVTALIMSAVALNVAVRGDERTVLPAAEKAISSGSAITGTGPGLIQLAQQATRVADLARIYSGSSVSGTGPGLSVLAEQATRTEALSQIYSGSRITGTGPALLYAAFGNSVVQVTGTGPGLEQIAKQTRLER
jgi:hypothetical protein